VACGAEVACCGFTHAGGQPTSSEEVQVYFKQSCVLTTDTAWSVYLTQQSAPKVGPPGSSPDKELFSRDVNARDTDTYSSLWSACLGCAGPNLHVRVRGRPLQFVSCGG
jgi:hypothetical protein